MAKKKLFGLSDKEKDACARLADDLSDEAMVDALAYSLEQAAAHGEFADIFSGVLHIRMLGDGVMIVPGTGPYRAELTSSSFYVWPADSLARVRDLLEAVGEEPSKYLSDTRGYEFKTPRAAEALIAKLEDLGVDWHDYIQDTGGITVKNSASLISWLRKLGPRAAGISWEKKASGHPKLEITRKAEKDGDS